MAAGELRQQRFGRCGGFFGIDVVEHHQPAGVLAQPLEHCVVLPGFFGFALLGQIEDPSPTEDGEVALQRHGVVGAGEEHRPVVVGAPPGVLKREARHADAADAVDHARGDRSRVLGDSPELGDEFLDCCFAALEELAEAAVGQTDWPGRRPGQREDLVELRAQQFHHQAVAIGKGDFRVALELRQPREMRLLRRGDEKRLAVIQPQPGFPLRVGDRRRIGFEERYKHRKATDQIQIALADHCQRRRLRQGTGHVADEVDYRVAVADVLVELVQHFAAGGDEILLHLDRDIRPVEVATQGVAVAAKLGAELDRKLFTVRMSCPFLAALSALHADEVLSGLSGWTTGVSKRRYAATTQAASRRQPGA